MEYEVLHHGEYFEVRTHGDAEPGGFRGFLDRLLAHEKWKPGTPILANHSDLNIGPLTSDQVRGVAAKAVTSSSELGPARVALLVARDLDFGLARMWQAFVAEKWNVEARVFRSRDEATAWLKNTGP